MTFIMQDSIGFFLSKIRPLYILFACLNKPSKKGKATAISSRTSKTKSASRTKRHSSGALLTVAEQDVVEGREDGAGKDVSLAAIALAANMNATAVLWLLREHGVHTCLPVLPPQEPRQGAAATGHHLCLAQPLRPSSEKPARHPAGEQEEVKWI